MSRARQTREYVESLHPETQGLFWAQIESREHAAEWVGAGPAQ